MTNPSAVTCRLVMFRTCETAGCTTDCSHRGRRSGWAPLLLSACSPQAGSRRSASSGPSTTTHHSINTERWSLNPEHPNTLCSVTYRSNLWIWVRPAGSHGAHDAPTGIHVEVPPGQDHLCSTTGLSHKAGGVRLKGAAHWFTEVHAVREELSCEQMMLRENSQWQHLSRPDTWTWCREDPAGWSCVETPDWAGCRTLNELQGSSPQRAEGPDGLLLPPPAAAEPSSTAAPTPPAERRRWPGEEPPHSPPAGWRTRGDRSEHWTPSVLHFIVI